MALRKALDTFAPCGPALVRNEIRIPQDLDIAARVNGQTLQQGDVVEVEIGGIRTLRNPVVHNG